ncbi:hypothetical protein BDR26DRAFT_963472 [Obelidium mucronatum]|nr:hypothetical protein BDR26DRAFT_965144 [Obelidium mucronatum]KAI9344041.1 hypothetical protein BDR26DRAFT_963472 [Obelidium mucronatum]
MNQGSSSTSNVSATSLTLANDVDEQRLYFVENVLSSMANVQNPDGGILDFMVDFWKKVDNSVGKLTEHTNTLMLIILMFGHMTKVLDFLEPSKRTTNRSGSGAVVTFQASQNAYQMLTKETSASKATRANKASGNNHMDIATRLAKDSRAILMAFEKLLPEGSVINSKTVDKLYSVLIELEQDDWDVADFEALVSAKLSSIQPRVQRQQAPESYHIIGGDGGGRRKPKRKAASSSSPSQAKPPTKRVIEDTTSESEGGGDGGGDPKGKQTGPPKGKGKGREKAAPKEQEINEIEEGEDFYYGGNSPGHGANQGIATDQREQELQSHHTDDSAYFDRNDLEFRNDTNSSLTSTAFVPTVSYETQVVVIFPRTGTNQVTIHKEDLERLQEGEFLNDTLIEFYIRYTTLTYNSDRLDKFHIFNTFFFQTLTTKDQGAEKLTIAHTYKKLQRWTRKIDIFKKRFLIIPINERIHWYLTVIWKPGAILAKEPDSKAADAVIVLDDDDDDGGSVIVENTVGLEQKTKDAGDKLSCTYKLAIGKHPHVGTNLVAYLAAEAKDKLNCSTIKETPTVIYAKVQHQKNFCDCGLFLLHYIAVMLRCPDKVSSAIMNGEPLNTAEFGTLLEIRAIRQFMKNKLGELIATGTQE